MESCHASNLTGEMLCAPKANHRCFHVYVPVYNARIRFRGFRNYLYSSHIRSCSDAPVIKEPRLDAFNDVVFVDDGLQFVIIVIIASIITTIYCYCLSYTSFIIASSSSTITSSLVRPLTLNHTCFLI